MRKVERMSESTKSDDSRRSIDSWLSNSRRAWLTKTICSAPLIAAARPRFSFASSVLSRIEVGVIGIGVRAKYLIANLPSELKVVALCDVSLRRIQSALEPTGPFAEILKPFATTDGRECRQFQDYREMLSTLRLDAVIICTPDHHHASAAILALKHGCHVYVEKPLATTIAEGRAIVKAASKFDRIVQVGSQQRSMKLDQIACEFIRGGGLGKIHRVIERNLPGPMPYERAKYPVQPIPKDLAWDLFCGPTAERDYHPDLWMKEDYRVGKLLWRGWDLFEDYSGHLTTNWGGHSLDMLQYALGTDDSGPVEIESLRTVGDKSDDDWSSKTPPLGTCTDPIADQARFRGVRLTYASGAKVELLDHVQVLTFFGERGSIVVNRNGYECNPAGLLPPMIPEEIRRWEGSGHVARPHLQNWVNAILSKETVVAPIETGHRSATVCHLINIARKFDRPLKWDPQNERFIDDSQANRYLARDRRPGYELA